MRLKSLLSVDDMVRGIHGYLTSVGEWDNTFFFFTSDHGYNLGQFRVVRVAGRSISPPWGSIRFRLALRTYAPCGCIVRVVSQTKSRTTPTRKILPLLCRNQDSDKTQVYDHNTRVPFLLKGPGIQVTGCGRL